MNDHEIPRQPTVALLLTVEKGSSQMSSPCQQAQIESATKHSSISPGATAIDWKLRFEASQYEHQRELERIHLHYERQLKEKITEIRTQLERDYEHKFHDFRAQLSEQQQQQQQQLHNLSSSSLGLDQSIGEQVREQIRLAQEYDRNDDERRQFLSKQSADSVELTKLVNKLYSEGVHVLTLSERLALRLNSVNTNTTESLVDSLQKLHEENFLLRSLIANMNANQSADKLITCLANVFRCEQERRLIQIRQHPNVDQLKQEIHAMCNYQRDALAKFFSNDRLAFINDFGQVKQAENQSVSPKFYFKYIRSENHRKALIYQKRYLLVLLTGYEDTEAYALNEIQRLTGGSKTNSYPYQYNYDKIKTIRKPPYQRRLSDYRFRFRYHVRVVIAIIRMRRLVKKWTEKLAAMKQ